MDNVVAGINEEELGNLSMEILNYADDISDIFSRIDSCISKLPSSYDCDVKTKIMNSYDVIKDNYKVVKSNIISYSDDLIELIQKMKEGDEYISNMFVEFTTEMQDKKRTIS